MVGIYLMQNFGNYGYLFWLPSALENAKKMSNQLVGVLTAVPFILTAIGMILVSRHSDKHRERRGHVAFGMAWGAPACWLYPRNRPLLHLGFCGNLPCGRRFLWDAGAVLGDSNGNSAALGFRICHGVDQCARQPGRVFRPAGGRLCLPPHGRLPIFLRLTQSGASGWRFVGHSFCLLGPPPANS